MSVIITLEEKMKIDSQPTIERGVVLGRAKLLDIGRLKDATFWSDAQIIEWYNKYCEKPHKDSPND